MVRIDEDEIIFSSGHTAYANHGIVGISPKLEISEGYDGYIDWPPPTLPTYWTRELPRPLTAADMIELADMMIERWTKFKGTLA